MSKSKPSTIISDADAKRLSEMDEKLSRSVNSLKQRNKELASLSNLLKANTSNTTSFMKKVADEVGLINDALSKTSTSMSALERNISTLSVNMARGFDKMAQAAQKALQASQAAGQASASVGASGGGATWWEKWRQRAQTADDKIFSADVRNGKGTDEDFQAMQRMETQWKTIVNVSSQYLNQMAQVAIQQEKLNLATSQQARELAEIASKYQQIARLNNATAQNQNFDEGTYTQTQRQRTSLQQKQAGATQGDSTLVEMQAQLAMMKEQLNTLRQKKKLDDESYRDQRRETLLQKERQRALDREIKAELERERVKKRIAELEAKGKLSVDEQIELEEKRARLEAEQSTTKSTTGTGASYFNTTGQMIQVIRELPNFAISMQTGLMSLSNNLPTLFEGFRMAASAGKGLNGVLKMIFSGATMLNLAFVAFTVVLMNLPAILKAINNDFIDMHQVLDEVGEGLKSGSSELAKQIDEWETLKHTLLEAQYGLADGAQALSDYNDKFATTLGYAESLADAYKTMTENSDEFYRSVMGHEIAMTIQKEALKQWREAIEKEVTDGTNLVSLLFGGKSNTANVINRVSDITGEIEKWRGGKNTVAFTMVGKDKLKAFMKKSGGEREITTDKGAKYVVYTGFNEKVNEEIKKKLGADTKIKVEFGRGGGMGGDIVMRLTSGNRMQVDQNERTAVATVLNDLFSDLTTSMAEEALKEAYKKMQQQMVFSDIFQQLDLEAKKGGGSAARAARTAPNLSVIQPRDGYTMDRFTSERREELVKENERLERNFSKQYDSGDKDMYQKRLDDLRDYIRNKQEIAEIDTQKEIFNANERRKRELHQIQEERESLQNRLENLKKRAAEWEKYKNSTEFKMGKDQAQANKDEAEREYNNLSDRLVSEGLVKGSEEYVEKMTKVTDNLSKAEETLASYLSKDGMNAAIAKSEANIADWEKKARDREKQIEKNFQTDYANAIYKGTSKVVKAREEGLQKAIELHKTALNTELDDVTRRYEKELRVIENFYDRLERLREQKGAEGYDNASALALKGAEVFATGVAGYSRDGNISKITRNRDAKRENEDTAQAADETREEVLDIINDYEDRVKDYAKNNSLDKERMETLRNEFKTGLEDSGKYNKNEIEGMMTEWDDAVKNLDTEEGQRAFDELRKSATKNLDETLEKAKETGEALNEEFKDQWVSAIEEQGVAAFKNMVDLLDAMLQAEIEYEKRAVNQWVETQTKLVEDQYKSQVIDEKEYQAQKEAIEAEQRKREHEIAVKEEKANRVKATSNVLIGTAQAITFAALAAFRDTPGPAAAALFAIYTALLSANAAAQIAAIHAAPYPEYAEGTDFHKGGLAIVGDAGKSELIETKSGRLYKTPDVPTLMDIERGAKVHPDFSVAMRDLNDDRRIVVLSENKKQLTLLRQTNRSLGAIVANTRTQQRNYNRVWN